MNSQGLEKTLLVHLVSPFFVLDGCLFNLKKPDLFNFENWSLHMNMTLFGIPPPPILRLLWSSYSLVASVNLSCAAPLPLHNLCSKATWPLLSRREFHAVWTVATNFKYLMLKGSSLSDKVMFQPISSHVWPLFTCRAYSPLIRRKDKPFPVHSPLGPTGVEKRGGLCDLRDVFWA